MDRLKKEPPASLSISPGRRAGSIGAASRHRARRRSFSRNVVVQEARTHPPVHGRRRDPDPFPREVGRLKPVRRAWHGREYLEQLLVITCRDGQAISCRVRRDGTGDGMMINIHEGKKYLVHYRWTRDGSMVDASSPGAFPPGRG